MNILRSTLIFILSAQHISSDYETTKAHNLFTVPPTADASSTDISLTLPEKLLECQAYSETGRFVRNIEPVVTGTNVKSLDACISLCWLFRKGFKCRSVNYNSNTNRCDILNYLPKFLPLEQGLTNRQRHSTFSIPTSCKDPDNASEEPETQQLPHVKSYSNCGVGVFPPFAQPPGLLNRITGGVESRPHSLPWSVSIQAHRQHICGGSIIQMDPNIMMSDLVLTAAHCVLEDTNKLRPDGELNVQLGAHRLSLIERGQENIRVKNIIAHHNYNFTNPFDDIAVVQLEYPVHFSKTIRPVCIPEEGSSATLGQMCLAAGWGMINADATSHNDHLLQVYVPILNISMCSQKDAYGDRIYPELMLCAGYMEGVHDSCQGDSGGPLVCKEDNRWVQHGVVSFGDGCGTPNKPGVYTKMSSHLQWLEDVKREFAKLRK